MAKSLFLIFLAIIISLGGQLSLKTGMNRIGRIDTIDLSSILLLIGKVALSPIILLGLGLYVVGFVVWLIVLSRVDLSFAYPMISLNYVLVILFSWLVLGEQIALTRLVGALVICTGVIILSRSM
ncbi:MAG: EamA family transporter [Deltaproteobacteria bacterium]|nr:MAG: EamA family transporter [Deltaproteobacteria bacterium]